MKYRVVEIYKSGEKVFMGKAHRKGWHIYKQIKDGSFIHDKILIEAKTT